MVEVECADGNWRQARVSKVLAHGLRYVLEDGSLLKGRSGFVSSLEVKKKLRRLWSGVKAEGKLGEEEEDCEEEDEATATDDGPAKKAATAAREDLFQSCIWLHAWRYSCRNEATGRAWSYEAPVPEWLVQLDAGSQT